MGCTRDVGPGPPTNRRSLMSKTTSAQFRGFATLENVSSETPKLIDCVTSSPSATGGVFFNAANRCPLPSPPNLPGQTFASRRRSHGSRACVGVVGRNGGARVGGARESLWSPEVRWSKVEGWPCQAASRASRNQGGLPTAPRRHPSQRPGCSPLHARRDQTGKTPSFEGAAEWRRG